MLKVYRINIFSPLTPLKSMFCTLDVTLTIMSLTQWMCASVCHVVGTHQNSNHELVMAFHLLLCCIEYVMKTTPAFLLKSPFGKSCFFKKCNSRYTISWSHWSGFRLGLDVWKRWMNIKRPFLRSQSPKFEACWRKKNGIIIRRMFSISLSCWTVWKICSCKKCCEKIWFGYFKRSGTTS